MVRLLQRNQRAIDAADADEARARLLAQRVLLLARHWRADEVAPALRAAEEAVAASADRLAGAELALARGVALYYGEQPDRALEPVAHACAEARVLADTALEAECEAWLGCIRATLHAEPAGVLAHLRAAVTLGRVHRPIAAARALYIAATLYQEADLLELAATHYRRAGALARAERDEQLLAAIHRYMTLGQVQQARRAHAAGRLDAEQQKQALAALGSAQQLALALTSDDAGPQFGLRLGEMLRLGGRHAEALAVFDAHLDDAARRGMGFEATIARADQAVCLAHCGQADAARAAGARAAAELEGAFDAYTRAVVRASLAELDAVLGDAASEATHAALAAACWDEDRAYCERLRRALLADGPLSD